MRKNFFMTAFYIISTRSKSGRNIFKIGICSRTAIGLLSRYSTYFMEPIIFYFQHLGDDAIKIENNIKNYFYDQRINNCRGHKSEWINIKYSKLYEYVKQIIPNGSNIIIDKFNNIDISQIREIDHGLKKAFRHNVGIHSHAIHARNIIKFTFDFNDLVNLDQYEYDYDKLSICSDLNKNEYIAYRKYILLKKTGVSDRRINSLSIKNYFYNEIYVDRFNILFGYKNFDDYHTDPYSIELEKQRINIVVDLVNRIIGKKFKQLNDDNLKCVEISTSQYNTAVKDIGKNSIFYKNLVNNSFLFFNCVRKCSDTMASRCYTKTIKAILLLYNIIFIQDKAIRVGRKTVRPYLLYVNKEIRDIALSINN